jgi:hypothetical protein
MEYGVMASVNCISTVDIRADEEAFALVPPEYVGLMRTGVGS